MSTEERDQQRCRYWLWAIAVLHLVCLLLRHAPEPQVAVSAPSHFASVIKISTSPRI